MTDQIKIDKRLIEKSPGSFIFEFDNEIPSEKCDEIVQRFEESKDDHYSCLLYTSDAADE